MSPSAVPEAREAADPVGEATLELFAGNEAYNRFLWSRLRALAPPRGRVLEVGCGIGNITRRILQEPEVEAVHAIDPDPVYVERTLALDDPRLGATVARVEDFVPGRCDEAAGASFDTIVCSNVLEHIADDGATVRNFARLLRPGGAVLLLVPAHPRLYGSLDRALSHHRRYTRGDLTELARGAGLRTVSCRHFNPLAAVGWWLNGRCLRRSTLPAGQLGLYARCGIGLSALLDRWNPFPLGVSLAAAFARPEVTGDAASGGG